MKTYKIHITVRDYADYYKYFLMDLENESYSTDNGIRWRNTFFILTEEEIFNIILMSNMSKENIISQFSPNAYLFKYDFCVWLRKNYCHKNK